MGESSERSGAAEVVGRPRHAVEAAFPALGPDAYNYTAARTTLDLSGDYQINKRCSLNTNIRNVFNAYLVNTRYGSVTPGYAQPRQYRHFGVYFSAGIKGTF